MNLLFQEKEIKEAKAHLERAYEFRANKPGILVYPSRTAKGGKFDCRTMSLNSLLDYRPEDNKEHSFEVCGTQLFLLILTEFFRFSCLRKPFVRC